MTSLFETARRAYLRATTYPARKPEWSTDTAACAAQCGQPVALGGPHWAVYQDAQRIRADGVVEPLVANELAFAHIGCWPTEGFTLTGREGWPEGSSLTAVEHTRRGEVRP